MISHKRQHLFVYQDLHTFQNKFLTCYLKDRLDFIIQKKFEKGVYRYYKEKIDFNEVMERSLNFANFLRTNFEKIVDILLRYESFEVVQDETNRTLDLLENLFENAGYFQRKVKSVAAFLPRNQPLYALSCFALIPSFMAEEVHVRPPQAMHSFFFDLVDILRLDEFFPNVHCSKKTREEFLKERASKRLNEQTGIQEPVTDVVIFTGTTERADELRQIFSNSVLFIANGAGHNPIVVTESANIEDAVFSAMRVQLYNQGQDCANPNAILVHKDSYEEFMKVLMSELKNVRVGEYKDRGIRVGPISERKDLKKIQTTFLENADWLQEETPGVIHTKKAIVEPTVIAKPLKEGGNFVEQFAPVFFVQKYDTDSELAEYFEDPRYENNAMYVTVFGDSTYIRNLPVARSPSGKMLHDTSTIIYNTDLHAKGVERGVNPYGGLGRGASSFSLFGKIVSCPTLPQREIFQQLILPSILVDEANFNFRRVPAVLATTKNERDILRENTVKIHDGTLDWCDVIVSKILKTFPDRKTHNVAMHMHDGNSFTARDARALLSCSMIVEKLKTKGLSSTLFIYLRDSDSEKKRRKSIPIAASVDFPTRFQEWKYEVQKVLEALNVKAIILSQNRQYESGTYRPFLKIASSVPSTIEVLSRFSGSENTEILSIDKEDVLYKCLDTGQIDTVSVFDEQIRLNPVADSAAFWSRYDICFELENTYSNEAGAYEDSKEFLATLTGQESPLKVSIGSVDCVFVYDKKIHHSSDASFAKILDFFESDMIKWLLLGRKLQESVKLFLDERIVHLYNSYDEYNVKTERSKMLSAVESQFVDFQHDPVPFHFLVTYGQLIDWDLNRFWHLCDQTENHFSRQSVLTRIVFARHWVEISGQEVVAFLEKSNTVYFSNLSRERLSNIEKLRQSMEKQFSTLKELEQEIFDIPKRPGANDDFNKDRQKEFFYDLYQLLLGRGSGPRMAALLWLSDKEKVKKLLTP